MKSENEYIAEEIRESGFPLEIEIAEVLEAHGWEVIPSTFYYDYDNDEFKEIDLLAYKSVAKSVKDSPNYPYAITMGLIIECKKRQDIAWIFFPRPRDPNDIDYSGVGLAAIDSLQVAKLSSFKALSSLPMLDRLDSTLKPKAFVPLAIARELWGAHQLGLVEARDFHCLSKEEKSLSYDVVKLTKRQKRFDRDSERKQIYSVLSGLAKAVEERLVKEAEMLQTLLDGALNDHVVRLHPHLRQFRLDYFFPVLILDGKLKAWRKGTVTDVDEILHKVSLRSKNYFHDRLVSVVIRRHFDKWLTQFEMDANALIQKIVNQRGKLDRQVELLEKNRIKTDMS